MGLIFFLSAQPDLGTDLGLIDLIGRKIAHAGVYALLTLLWWWALGGADPDPAGDRAGAIAGDRAARRAVRGGRPALIVAAAVALLYAISDEYHQSFVEDRVGSPIDIAIDSIGIAAACLLVESGRAAGLVAWLRRSLSRG